MNQGVSFGREFTEFSIEEKLKRKLLATIDRMKPADIFRMTADTDGNVPDNLKCFISQFTGKLDF